MLTIREILNNLDALAPPAASEEWDNNGLLVGDPNWKTAGAVVSIDLTAEAIKKAVSRKARLIVNHHPCIFPKNRGLSRLTPGHLAYDALQAGVAVVACHTNFDQCALEVVQAVSHGLKCEPKGRLVEEPEESLLKLVVFVPDTHAEAVREAICAAGAGRIGNYDQCAFATSGVGTFRGDSGTKPFLGKPGKLEHASEVRLETVLPRGLKDAVLQSLVKAHPYEEIAYDLYPLEQAPGSQGLIRGLGYGFWADFTRPRAFAELAKDVKSLFNLDGFWLSDPAPSRVKRVAFVAGKGSSFMNAARSVGCDLFITGEAGYHDSLRGSRRGMAVMELGHRESERFFLTTMEGWLVKMGIKATALNTPTQRIWK